MANINEYRIIETIGPHWNRRWELQQRYSYWEHIGKELKQIFSWHMVCCGTKEFCEEALERRMNNGYTKRIQKCNQVS